MSLQKQDSLKKRYFFKLFTSFFGLGISLITVGIIPRGLGPGAYGDFNFLNNFFSQLIAFLNLGTTMGFYTNVSKRQKEFKLVTFYIFFAILISILIGLFILLVRFSGLFKIFFPGQAMPYVCLAALFAFTVFFVEIFNSVADACGLTVPLEIARAIQKIAGLALILWIFLTHSLNLSNFFFYNLIITFITLFLFMRIVRNFGYSFTKYWRLKKEEVIAYIREFYHYCHPLVVYSFVCVVINIFDRWFLQIYGGSVQQGFFGLSFQVGAVCFLFCSAMAPLFTREFSVAHSKSNVPEMRRLFLKHIPFLYSVTAALTCFIVFNSGKVSLLLGGDKFRAASLAVGIMAFYPIHQVYGQLSGSVFFSTGQTKLYRNIGIVSVLFGLLLTYLFIAPRNLGGLALGANGLALKMVIFNIVAVNLQLYFNCRYLKLSFLKLVWHQFFSVLIFLSVSLVLTLSVTLLLSAYNNLVLIFLLEGLLYCCAVLALIYFVPFIFGLEHQDVQGIMHRLKFVK